METGVRRRNPAAWADQTAWVLNIYSTSESVNYGDMTARDTRILRLNLCYADGFFKIVVLRSSACTGRGHA